MKQVQYSAEDLQVLLDGITDAIHHMAKKIESGNASHALTQEYHSALAQRAEWHMQLHAKEVSHA